MSNTPYDPTLRGLIALTSEDWKDPDEMQESMVWFGINYVDQALFGMNFISGEIIGIQAEEKRRKSTMLANVTINVAAQKKGFWTCIDTLESGMPPKAYRDMLIAIVATRIMIAEIFGTKRTEWPSYHDIKAHPSLGTQLELSKEFLWYARRSEKQQSAIERARLILSDTPITIFGSSPTEGGARNLGASVARWDKLYKGEHPKAEGCLHRLFVADHIQQFSGWESDYTKLEAVVNAHSEFVGTHPGTVVIDVSQLSTTSVRLEQQGFGHAKAKGGAKLGAEVNVLFRTEYDKDGAPHKMVISVAETRRRPPPPVVQELEPNSGAFLRPAYPARRLNEGED